VVSENFSAVRDGKLTDSLRFSVYLAFMSRACTICQNPKRADIDRRLAGGEPTARIARDAGVSLPSLYRHRLNCLGLGSSNEIMKEIARGSAAIALLPSKENLSHAYSDLQTRIDKIVAQAQQQGSLQVALASTRSEQL
jgi:hypothetical protein